MRRLVETLFVCSALAIAGCAQAPMPAAPAAGAAQAGECFRGEQVNGYSSVSDEVVDVKVGASRYYRLQTLGRCAAPMLSQPFTLRTLGGGSWICRGLDAEIVSAGDRCLVRGVTPISREMYQAGGKAR